MLFLLVFLLFSQLTMSQTKDSCDELRDKLANTTSKFVSCAIIHSRPVTMCENCVQNYLDILETYHNMTEIVDNETRCIDMFVHLDRLEIVDSLYSNSNNLWNDAKCYNCFQSDNGTLTSNKSPEAQIFQEYYNNLTHCITENNASDTILCKKCLNNYTRLDEFFHKISNENERIGTCMDLVDLMNTTRSFWSKSCCKYRRHNEYIFIVSTIIVLISTLCFYVIAQFCTVKKEPTILQQRRLAESFNQTSYADEQ